MGFCRSVGKPSAKARERRTARLLVILMSVTIVTADPSVPPKSLGISRAQNPWTEVSTFADAEIASSGRTKTSQERSIGGMLANRSALGRRKVPRKRRRSIIRADNVRERKVPSETIDASNLAYEQRLIQIGQDIHDGPIQLLTVLGIRLNEATDERHNSFAKEVVDLKSAAHDLIVRALSELREISTGLVLQRLDGLTAGQTLRLAVHEHERATATPVQCQIDALGFEPSPAMRVCMFRIVQECLNNSYYYSNGQQQQVSACLVAHSIAINVSDSGSGFARRLKDNSKTGLGLSGLRYRVEALRGTLRIDFHPSGTRVIAMLPV